MEGNRVAKTEGGGGKLPWIIAGVVAGILIAAYLGLCAYTYHQNTILPNMSVAGINVSNMTVEQARDTVEAAASQRSKDITLALTYEDLEETLDVSRLKVDTAKSVQDAWAVGHGNFITGGACFLSHLLGMSGQVPLAMAEDEPAQADLMERMKRTVNAAMEGHGYQVEGDKLVMTKGAPVTTVDWDRAKADVRSALQDAFHRVLSGESPKADSKVPLPASQGRLEDPDFEAIHRELAREPKDASLDLASMQITDHVVGVDFDVEQLKQAYQQAKSGETFSIPVTLTQPKVTREDLGGRLFKDILGEATTVVGGSAVRKNNVKLATDACNNAIILPGEEFSYNEATGRRTVEKGYGSAPIYVNGLTVSETAGGVCQGSSTIYYALLHTTLEVVERTPHRFAVTYVPDGMDATVSYGSLDFRFKNNTDYPIKLVTSNYDEGGIRKLNVKIYGTNVDGRYGVPSSGVFNVVTPTVRYVADPSVPQGTLVLDRQQNAYRGKSAQTYRTIYAADGTQLEKQNMGVSVYKMRPSTYYYNPADGDPSTWVDGQPPAAPSTDPGATTPGTTTPGTTTPGTTTPGTTTDPGTATNPGTTPDPGTTAPDPGTVTPDPGAAPQPEPSDSRLEPVDPGADG